MKKTILLIFIPIVVAIIYFFTYKSNDLIFSIGIDEGDITYKPCDYRITDIIIDIENNIDISKHKIQNILVKASTINIDINKYMNIKNYESILQQIEDLEVLFKLIRIYSKEDVNIIKLREKNELCEYANKKIILLAEKYDIMVVR